MTWQVYCQPAARTAQQVRSIAGTSGSLVSQPGKLYRNSVQVLYLLQHGNSVLHCCVKMTTRLEAPPGSRLQLDWLQFQLEDSPGCSGDWLELQEEGGRRMERLCGDWTGRLAQLPRLSRGSSLVLVFHTDSTVRGQGWRLHWTAQPAWQCPAAMLNSPGILNSPTPVPDPSHAPSHAPVPGMPYNCSTLITAPAGHHVLLTFTRFSLGPAPLRTGPACTESWLELDLEPGRPGEAVVRLCGAAPPGPPPAFLSLSKGEHHHKEPVATLTD